MTNYQSETIARLQAFPVFDNDKLDCTLKSIMENRPAMRACSYCIPVSIVM